MFLYHKTIQTVLNYKDKIQNSVGLSDVFPLHAFLLWHSIRRNVRWEIWQMFL